MLATEDSKSTHCNFTDSCGYLLMEKLVSNAYNLVKHFSQKSSIVSILMRSSSTELEMNHEVRID